MNDRLMKFSVGLQQSDAMEVFNREAAQQSGGTIIESGLKDDAADLLRFSRIRAIVFIIVERNTHRQRHTLG